MNSRYRAVVVVITALLYGSAAVAADKTPLEPQIPGATTACVWTGKELLVWSGAGRAFALDPEKAAWRTVATEPYAGRILQQELLKLSDGSILAAYWVKGEKTGLSFDRFFPDSGQWRHLAFVKFEDFKSENGKAYENSSYTVGNEKYLAFPLEVSGMAALGDGAVVLITSNLGGGAVQGVRVTTSGSAQFISRQGALPQIIGRGDSGVYAAGGKVLYFGYAHVKANIWGVWDDKTDRWSKPAETDPRYAFGHCQVGEEVYAFGGGEGSAYSLTKRDFTVYSFKNDRWRPLSVENGPPGRLDCSMCWTGKEVLVWGGQLLPGSVLPEHEQGAAKVTLNAVVGFDPATRRWSVLPGDDAPPARAYFATVWTGKEMIVWGGGFGKDIRTDGYAYNPQLGRWRKLPEVPKEH